MATISSHLGAVDFPQIGLPAGGPSFSPCSLVTFRAFYVVKPARDAAHYANSVLVLMGGLHFLHRSVKYYLVPTGRLGSWPIEAAAAYYSLYF